MPPPHTLSPVPVPHAVLEGPSILAPVLAAINALIQAGRSTEVKSMLNLRGREERRKKGKDRGKGKEMNDFPFRVGRVPGHGTRPWRRPPHTGRSRYPGKGKGTRRR